MTIKKHGDKTSGEILPEEDEEEAQKTAAQHWTPKDDELLQDELNDDE